MWEGAQILAAICMIIKMLQYKSGELWYDDHYQPSALLSFTEICYLLL